MTKEQLTATFTRHPGPDAKQDKAGTAHDSVTAAAVAFATALFDVIPQRPENEEAVRNALAHIGSAVDCAVEAIEERVAAPVLHPPVFAADHEPEAPVPPVEQ